MSEAIARILVVDDEPTNIRFLEGVLKGRYQVISASNGFEAIMRVKELAPDLILLDVMMPDLNGFDVVRVLKAEESFAEIPVIFLTAMDSCEAEAEGLGAGGIDYLTKPVDVALLLLRVRNHLELKLKNDLIRQQRDELRLCNASLEAALARIRTLEGTLSICMHCKSIRNDGASWQKIEEYLLLHTDASFSHGICPECLVRHYASLSGGRAAEQVTG
jgi:DNA-binding response OmpR family regulator